VKLHEIFVETEKRPKRHYKKKRNEHCAYKYFSFQASIVINTQSFIQFNETVSTVEVQSSRVPLYCSESSHAASNGRMTYELKLSGGKRSWPNLSHLSTCTQRD
jgi:hypothetical protein